MQQLQRHLASDIDAFSWEIVCFLPTHPLFDGFDAPLRVNALLYQRNLYIAQKCI